MPSSWNIGRVFGVTVGVHWTWLIIVAYLTYSLAVSYLPDAAPGYGDATYWVVGGAAAALLFISVLFHELAHPLAARAQGMEADHIMLFIFGGISNIQERPSRPRAEFIMTVVGR